MDIPMLSELEDATAELRQILGAFDVHPRPPRGSLARREAVKRKPFESTAAQESQSRQPAPAKLRGTAPPRPPSIVDRMRWERKEAKEHEAAAAAAVAAAQADVRVQKLGRTGFRFSQTRPAELAQLETSPLPAARGFAPIVIKGIPPSNAELVPRRVRTRAIPPGAGAEGSDAGAHPPGPENVRSASLSEGVVGPGGPSPWGLAGLPPIHVHIALPESAGAARGGEGPPRDAGGRPPVRRGTVSVVPIAPAAAARAPAHAPPSAALPSHRHRHSSVVVAVPLPPPQPRPTPASPGDSLRSAEDRPGDATQVSAQLRDVWRDVLGALASTAATLRESSAPPPRQPPQLSDELLLEMVSTACMRAEQGDSRREARSVRSLVDEALSRLDGLAGSVENLARDAAVDRRDAAARAEAAAASAALIGSASPAYPGVSRVELVRALADTAEDVGARFGAELTSATQALASAAHATRADLLGRAAQIAAEASEATRGAVVRELVPPLALLADGLHSLRAQVDAAAQAAATAGSDAEARRLEEQRLLAEAAATAAREGVRSGLEGLEARLAALLSPPPAPPPVAGADESPYGSDRSTLSAASSEASAEASQAPRSEGEVSSLGEGGGALAYLGAPLRHVEPLGGGGDSGGGVLGLSAATTRRRLPPPGWTVDPSDLSAGEVVLLPPGGGGEAGEAGGGEEDDDYSVGELVELLPLSLGRRSGGAPGE